MEKDLKTLTLERYLEEIKMRLDAHDQSDRYRALFARNTEGLDASIKENLTRYDALIAAHDTHYKEELAIRKQTFDLTIKGTHEKYLAAQKDAEKAMEALQKKTKQTLEVADQESQQLNITYDGTYETLNQAQIKDIKRLQETLKSYDKEHQVNQEELAESTKTQQEAIQKRLDEAKKRFDEEHDALTQKAASEKEDIHVKIEETLRAFAKEVSRLEEAHEKACEPYHKERQSIDAHHTREKEAIQQQYQAALNKKEQYAKEAEKINDLTSKQNYQREIKQINKELQLALSEENERYQAALKPFLEKEKAFYHKQNQAFFNLKMEHLERLITLKKASQKLKTEELLDLDELNSAYNIEEKTAQTELEHNRLDHTIQALNYDQKKFEQTLHTENEKALLGPAFDMDVLSAKEDLDQGLNDLERTRQLAKLEEKDGLLSFDQRRSYESTQKTLQLKTLEAFFTYDKALMTYEHARHLTEALYFREKMLVGHYHKGAQNYAALKAITLSPYEAAHFKSLEAKRDDLVAFYSERVEEAKKEHELIVARVEATHALEMEPLIARMDEFNARHEAAVKKQEHALQKKKQALSMQGKDKKRNQKVLDQIMQEHKKALESIQAAHERDIAPLMALKRTIDNAKVASLEEAETLLNHTIDACEGLLDHIERLIEEEKEALKQADQKLKQRSGLFEMFQYQRKEDTIKALTRYQRADLNALENAATRAETQLLELLDQYESQEALNEQKYQAATEKRKAAFDEKKTAIIEDHAAYSKQLAQETAENKRRATLNAAQLKRQYEQNLAQLTEQITQERNKYFAEKERFERALNKERERLEDQLDKERDLKQDRLNKYLEQLDNQRLQLSIALEDNAINMLKASDESFILGVLDDTIAIDELRH